MPSIRAKTVDILAQVRTQLNADAQTAAGNALLSKTEQNGLVDGDVLKEVAPDVRTQDGSVHVGPLVDAASARIQTLLGGVNTTTPDYVSKTEVKKLAGVDFGAATRVAKAFELITGKAIDLVPAKPAKPGSQSALPLANLAIGANGMMGLGGALNGNALELKGMGGAPGSIDLDVNGEHLHADFAAGKQSLGGVGGAFDARNVVEGLRDALPGDLDMRVALVKPGSFVVDFWPKGQAPAVDNAPQYGVFVGPPGTNVMMTGPLAVKLTSVPVPQGTTFSFRVDDKLYSATAQTSSATAAALCFDLKSQMEADGRTVVVKDYGLNNFLSLRVTG